MGFGPDSAFHLAILLFSRMKIERFAVSPTTLSGAGQ